MSERTEESYSEVPDNGRRGNPLPGCDCEACFGRCMVNPEVAMREAWRRSDEMSRAVVEKNASIVE